MSRGLNSEDVLGIAAHCQFRTKTMATHFSITPRHLHRESTRIFFASAQDLLKALRILATPSVLNHIRCIKSATDFLGYKQSSHLSRQFSSTFRTCPREFLRATRDQQTEILKGIRDMSALDKICPQQIAFFHSTVHDRVVEKFPKAPGRPVRSVQGLESQTQFQTRVDVLLAFSGLYHSAGITLLW